jgi:hypothetical protein
MMKGLYRRYRVGAVHPEPAFLNRHTSILSRSSKSYSPSCYGPLHPESALQFEIALVYQSGVHHVALWLQGEETSDQAALLPVGLVELVLIDTVDGHGFCPHATSMKVTGLIPGAQKCSEHIVLRILSFGS